ncbi:MAG: MBL fold metallo-hydrolase [Ruminococcaceae bacterium]|nr:MBL fold metallo-hydrolase [Oscillospiraceae bacterium]
MFCSFLIVYLQYKLLSNEVMLMMNNIIETNAQQTEKGFFLETTEHYITIETTVDSNDYYQINIGYSHEDWEAFLSVTVTYPDGEETKFIHGIPHGKNEALFPLYLKKGKNILSFQHNYCLGTYISFVKNIGKVEKLNYEISPKKDLLFISKKKTLKTFLKNYKQPLVKIETSEGKNIPFQTKETSSSNALRNDMIDVFPDINTIYKLGNGTHTLNFFLANGEVLKQEIEIQNTVPETKLQIINFNVGSANSTLIFLPNGKKLLIDSGTETAAREKLLPWFKKNSITLDYYLLTHFHDDHDGCKDEIIEKNNISIPDPEKANELLKSNKEMRYNYLKKFSYLNSTMLCCYDELHKIWDLGDVKIDILNSRFDENGDSVEIYNYPFIKNNEHNYENATSVSFMLDYNGYRYYHGADNYAYAQERYMYDMIKAKRTKELNCHWFYANHHFICDISPVFINTLNPAVVYVPNGFIYHRTLYIEYYKKCVENYYFESKRLENTLFSNETGNAKISVNSADNWFYEILQDEDI